ncbi:sodium:solute symporter [Propionibacterium sp. NM47_B9-13]|nr:sodium:solute symporter [Propionibacterium sp. NM47_B9-13]
MNGSFAGRNPLSTELSVRRWRQRRWCCLHFTHSKCLRTQNYRVRVRSCHTGGLWFPPGATPTRPFSSAPTERTAPHNAVGDTHQRRVR